MLRRFLCAFISLMLAICPAMIAVAENQVFSMAGFDGDDSNHNWSTNLFFSRMAEKTGISFTFNEYTNYTDWQNVKAAMFNTGELPDVLFKGALTSAEQIKYYESGQLIDLRPYLEESAPNLYAILQSHPDWLSAISLPDGAIVALPAINELQAQNAMWINKTWLDRVGLDMPGNIQELRTVLEAFRDKDPNQNGKNDEVPFAFLGAWDLKFLGHAFGIVANDYNIYMDEQQQIAFAACGDTYRKFLSWLHALYQDGLLESDGFATADTLRAITDDGAKQIYGIVMGATPANLMPTEMAEEYVLLEPLAYNGKQVYRELYGSVIPGTFAITKECKDPAKVLSWVDYLYTEEGGILALAGLEGTEYTVDANGSWDWIGDSYTVAYDVAINNIVSDTGNMPWRVPLDFEMKFDNSTSGRIFSALVKMQDYTVMPVPPVMLSESRQEQVTSLQNVLGAYVDMMLGRFVLGQVELTDENWAAYEKGLTERGLNDFITLWQDIMKN